jgi:two-component system response regulator DegU
MKLLIVDDNPRMRDLIQKFFTEPPAQVAACADGAGALAAYQQFLPDWVLMDIRMKSVNGLTATRQIKAADPKAKIIIVTNFSDPELREAAREAGACAFVLKEDLSPLQQLITGSKPTD